MVTYQAGDGNLLLFSCTNLLNYRFHILSVAMLRIGSETGRTDCTSLLIYRLMDFGGSTAHLVCSIKM